MRGRSLGLAQACAVAFLLTAFAAPAEAAIPQSLTDACEHSDAADGDTSNGITLPFYFCDDGVPSSGGRDANAGAVKAVPVPQRYANFAGLPDKVLPPDPDSGADANGDIAIDADLSFPDPARTPMPAGGYPLVVMMHGCCSGNKTGWESDTVDAPGSKEAWHYNNAWFASRGYVVLTYTSRGFVNREGNGSTGETQLDDRRYEINDYQHLAGQIADAGFRIGGRDAAVNGRKVITTGGSYGGGFSWMAFTDPTWKSPGGERMRLLASAPKYGWTDLVQSLVPTGMHRRDSLPPTDGSASTSPLGFPKRSIVAGLYASGKVGIPPALDHATFPDAVDDAFACLQSADPFESNPLCTTTLQTTMPGFIAHRSAYYQNHFFERLESGDRAARVPLFSAGAFSDPLFPSLEHRRMVDRLLSVDRGYPVQEYYGDYNHFVQNKRKEWADICGDDRHTCTFDDYPGGELDARPRGRARVGVTTRLNRFLDHYARPHANRNESKPAQDVTASLQVCRDNASERFPLDEPGERFTASSFDRLAPKRLRLEANGSQTTTSNAEPNLHAARSEPIANERTNGAGCPVESTPAGPGVASYTFETLKRDFTMIGRTRVTVPHTGTGNGIQLNARLYDVHPDGKQVMVDRGVRRVRRPEATTVFDLHGNGWRFPEGHRIRIELAQDDDPFIKASNQLSTLTLAGVKLSVPVREGGGNVAVPDPDPDDEDDGTGPGPSSGEGGTSGSDGSDGSAASAGTAGDDAGGDLPFTGLQLALLLAAGLALLAGDAALRSRDRP